MSNSHSSYVDAIRIWHDGLMSGTYLFFTRYYHNFIPQAVHRDDHSRVGTHVLMYVCEFICRVSSATRLSSCELNDARHSERVYNDIWYVNEHSEVGYWCNSYIDVIRGYLKELQSLRESTKYSNNELKRSYLYLRQMGTTGRDCSVIRQVQFPSGYVLHLEMFIGLWISVLPFGLVERSGQSSPGTP